MHQLTSSNSYLALLIVLFVATTTCACTTFVHAQNSYHVNTIGGSYPFGYNGDNIPATQAHLAVPAGIALSPSNNGDIIFSDLANNRIRQIVASTGKIQTVAGSGYIGYINTTIATMARFNNPTGVAFLNSDTVLVSDTNNHVIQKIILSSGSISTFTGQVGKPGDSGDGGHVSSALLNTPLEIAIWNDKLYIVDGSNNKIRVISLMDGTITTIAGGGTDTSNIVQDARNAKLNFPQSIAISPITGEVYIGEYGTIRKILNNGTSVVLFTTATLTGKPGPMQVPGMGVSPLTGALYVSVPPSIYMIQPNGTTSSIATMYYPRSITVSSIGEVFVSDGGLDLIRKITTNNRVRTVAGIGIVPYNGDDIEAVKALLYLPDSVAVAPNNEVIVADTRNNRLRKISLRGIITTITISNNLSPTSPLVTKLGEYYFLDSTTLNYYVASSDLTKSIGTFNSPKGVVRDKNGDLLVADTGTNVIRKVFSNTESIITIAGNGTLTGDNQLATNVILNKPYGIVLTSSEEVIFSEYEGHRVRKILSNGTIISIAGTGEKGYSGENLDGVNSKLSNPASLAILSNDELLICDSTNHVIRKLFKNGTLTTIAGIPTQYGFYGEGTLPLETLFYEPTGVAVSSNEKVMYIADKSNGKVRAISFGCELMNNCSGHGDCIMNNCSCYSGWRASLDCSLFSCELMNNCSGNGVCTASNTCSCMEGYNGTICENKNVATPVLESKSFVGSSTSLIVGLAVGLSLLLIIIVVAVLVAIILIAVSLKKKRKNKRNNNNSTIASQEKLIEMTSTVSENVTTQPSRSSTILASDLPSDTYNNSFYMLTNSSGTSTTTSSTPSQSTDHSILKDRYKIQQVIGAGSFGKCFLCLDSKKNDMPVAIKTINYDQSRYSKIIDECSKTMSYRHPNLVEVYEFFEAQIIQSVCIVMKYYVGDLEHALKDLKQNGKIVSEKMIISIMNQLGDALNYLHQEKSIIHRDIKPRNIFYSKLDTELDEIQVVIGDYGEAKETGETQNSVTGTLQYMAPEVFTRKYSYSADVFSLGVSLIQAMADETLDLNITAQLLYDKEDVVMNKMLEHLISRGYSEKLCNFVMSMVAKEPSMRPSSADIQKFI